MSVLSVRKPPHSRIEYIIFKIIDEQDSKILIIDDPSDLGTGLKVDDDTIMIDADTTLNQDSNKPITSGAINDQMDIVEDIMSRI